MKTKWSACEILAIAANKKAAGVNKREKNNSQTFKQGKWLKPN
jgi:hypothetical protein